jgi:hypothetical protein
MTDDAKAESTAQPPNGGRPNVDDRELLVFLVRLPTPLPIAHGTIFSLQLPGDLGDKWNLIAGIAPAPGSAPLYGARMRAPFVSLKLWQYKRSSAVGDEMLPEIDAVLREILPVELQPRKEVAATLAGAFKVDHYSTIVEAVTQLPDSSNAVSEAFDRSLEAINRLVLAYSFVRRDPTVERVAREYIDPIVVYLRRPASSPPRSGPQVLMTGGVNMTYERPVVVAEQVQIIAHYLGLSARGHPLVSSAQFMLERSRAYLRGDYTSAVIWAAVTQEMVMNLYLRMLLVEEGNAAPDRQAHSTALGLKTRLNSQFAHRLGGRWNTNDETTAVGRWWRDCQRVRGRVVHAGYVPNRAEAKRASDTSTELDDYVGDLLAKARFRFPMTAYTRLGLPGLQRRGALSKRFGRVVQAVEPKLDQFWRAVRSNSSLEEE